MAEDRKNVEDAHFGALLGRLFDDGRKLVKAEVGVHVATVKCRVMQSKAAVAMLVAAAVLANAAVIVLLIGIAAQVALWIGGSAGALAGAAITTLLVLLLAYVLVRVALRRLSPAPSAEVPVSIEELSK